MTVYVITNAENGWDCVLGVYASFEGVLEFLYECFEGELITEDFDSANSVEELEEILGDYDSSFVIHIKELHE